MTEKRFRPVSCVTDWYIEDKKISPFTVLTPHQASDLLNELHDENEHLKKFVKRQQSSNNECSKLIEEQQKENQRLIKMLDNVANYMQKENKYMPIDDFVEWWNNIATKGLDGDVE